MGLTITLDTPKTERISRNYGMITGSIAFDTSYPTGGEDSSDITDYFKTCLQIMVEPNTGYSFQWDKTNDLMKAFWVDTTVDGAAQAEVVNTTDISAITAAKFVAFGLI